ncbi:hypothetical protein, conserved [Leishmania tarentolae]|uniref:Uncharacterized protein n=1 Tax=Leishmania tarentolae TaxID=5689 RepID=A0A640KN00_LEITA|nr:hypothetical protein, conserved [Leishmania tarentolae]
MMQRRVCLGGGGVGKYGVFRESRSRSEMATTSITRLSTARSVHGLVWVAASAGSEFFVPATVCLKLICAVRWLCVLQTLEQLCVLLCNGGEPLVSKSLRVDCLVVVAPRFRGINAAASVHDVHHLLHQFLVITGYLLRARGVATRRADRPHIGTALRCPVVNVALLIVQPFNVLPIVSLLLSL